ncbi:2-oxo acid dehydrogenase subunit E2 [Calidifontimicrobium sp. SYSU G02091]|uniref:dihydrolipoamide acetyltransferase family protein n=1 Tax=Calidifontimicrobium sp. SYSU G02091 TaxID=2926421 RepID=UPI001F52D69E|nr:dihydrolipoamide acetyltransferase family protein [Calidifontimicrobium sp. SYSU G02091]MCI1193574.1 2-oxo acid dehydrogenase subunit E2 [Calidifontimicrobium sp. SYSU G02091]
MADFTMPALGADMETGKVVEWLVKPGDRVKPGDVIAVVETHKGAIDVECFLDGVIDDLAPLGVDLPVGAVLAHVRVAGEAAAVAPAAAPTPAPSPVASPAPPAAPEAAAAAAAVRAPAAPPPREVPAAPAPIAAPPAVAAATRARVSPAARRRAAELGIDADALHGTGVDGAVTLADVELAAAQPRARPAPALAPTAPPRPSKGGFDPALMRQAIAAAMGKSKREIPHYYLATTIDFAAAQAWLDAYNAERDPAERLLPATLLLKATAKALVEVPQLNGFWKDDAFEPGAGIHLGWAIALRGGGLVAPAIHDADKKTLPELMAALRDLVQRARSGGLRSSELTDPTITVTSLGDRGAESVLGVIYPPQVAIVGFGRIVVRPWVVDDAVVPRPLVTTTLAADHRASDGHVGGLLLAAIDRALQLPQTL